jgi:hypothetical protein
MSVALTANGTIEMRAQCAMAEAETLHGLLARNPGAVVDWRACTYAHTAVIQVLVAARPKLIGPPAGTFLRSFVEAAIA